MESSFCPCFVHVFFSAYLAILRLLKCQSSGWGLFPERSIFGHICDSQRSQDLTLQRPPVSKTKLSERSTESDESAFVCQSQKQRINRIRWMEAALPTSLWNRRLHINSLSWARATSSVCAKLMLKFAQNKYPTGRVSFVRVTNSFWWTYLRSAAGSSLLACHPDVDPSKALLEWHLSFRAKHTSQRCKRLIA